MTTDAIAIKAIKDALGSSGPHLRPEARALFFVVGGFRFAVVAENIHCFKGAVGIADLGDVEQPVALVDHGQVGPADDDPADLAGNSLLGIAERVGDNAEPCAGLDQGAEADGIAHRRVDCCAIPSAS